jgi:hypothetical protein
MPGLVPGIHVFIRKQDVDGRDKPGHDKGEKVLKRRTGLGKASGGWPQCAESGRNYSPENQL